jgi:pimeloyl-ACP methyl ester carboxylesterase
MAIERARANGLTIAYEALGDPAGRPLLLVAGLGRQLIGWHDEFCDALADRGHLVVRFDNRDVGESTHLDDVPLPDLRACIAGDASSAPYSLADMAADAAALLDVLEIESAHVVGASLGGMIAQTLAFEHPGRVRSLTSIMSTTGERAAAEATAEATEVLFQSPARSREEAIERALEGARVIGSPGFPIDEDWIRERAGRAFDRCYDPSGVARQLAAVYASGDRTEALRAVRVPTLVIHGEEDPLIPVGGGRATAAAIAGAELLTIPGMGHDLPRDLWPRIADRVAALTERAERDHLPVAG